LSKNVFNKLYRNFFKRFFDIIFSFLALIVLSPLLFIIALLVRIKLGSPVIFKQERPGLNEKIFTLYKFRTMTDKKDEQGNLLSDSERLTSFGRWLRSTSLDELPELWNILKGEMSIVGPRPLLVEYLPRYNDKQRRRHLVRPGLTGLAQVSGRNAISWEERFSLDSEYVNSLSFFMDTKIILKSIKEVRLLQNKLFSRI
jgi:undecaprenyl phosphate N,N'-diacetylbacillosamine 1-phosphate transferase